jgi:aminoglycoside phosphotransferase (APT) family kinase protein
MYVKRSSPETLPANLGTALERLHDELEPVSMPLSLAHGDFTPWNTRLGPRTLFVLDWERASEAMSPLYDALTIAVRPIATSSSTPTVRRSGRRASAARHVRLGTGSDGLRR